MPSVKACTASSGSSRTAVVSAVRPAGRRRASAAPARRSAPGEASPTPRNSTVTACRAQPDHRLGGFARPAGQFGAGDDLGRTHPQVRVQAGRTRPQVPGPGTRPPGCVRGARTPCPPGVIHRSEADPLLTPRNHLRQRGGGLTRSRTAPSLTDDRSLRMHQTLRERSAITGSYFDFAASAFVASAPDLVASVLDFGTNCPCTRPDLALVSTTYKPFLRS